MKSLKNQGAAPQFLLIGFLVIGIVVFVGAIVTQNFSLNSDAATAEPSCTQVQSVLSVLPVNAQALAGGTVQYELSIINRDKPSCGPTSFDITYAFPSGISLVSGATKLLVDTGSQSTTTFLVKSSATLAATKYPLTVHISSPGEPLHSASFPFNYIVVKQVTNPSATPKVVNNIPVVVTRLLPRATAGKQYSAEIRAQDPDNDKVVSMIITGMPSAIVQGPCSMSNGDVNFTTCSISGVPAAAGTYPLTVVAKDSKGATRTATLSLVVAKSGLLSVLP